MVLPIIILIILSMILLIIYFYTCLNTQVKAHQQINIEANNSAQMFNIKKNNIKTSTHLGGAVSLILNKNIQCRTYVINNAKIKRLGEGLFND